jgi:hypothetical protein
MSKNSDLYEGQVTRPYKKWSDVKLSVETQRIKLSMFENPFFPNPEPNMTVFGDAIAAYVSQLAKAGTRDSSAIAAKNVRRARLIELVTTLGYSVADQAKGDVEALVSSGLPLKKRRELITLTAPVNLRIINGSNSGELMLSVNTIKGASSFGFEYTVDPPTDKSVWIKTICSTSKCTVKGLEPGKKYWFRAFVTGARGQQITGEMMQSPYVQ